MLNFFKKTELPERRNIPIQSGKRISSTRFMDAAKIDPLNAGWITTNYSADAILRYQLAIARARSRQLSVNDPYFSRFLKLCQENIVGSSGIALGMRVIDALLSDGTVKLDVAANRMIEEAWWQWGKRKHCTLNQRDSMLNVQNMVLTSVVRDGEIFIRKIRGGKHQFGFCLQLIEADQVPINLDRELPNGNRIRMGIETNANDQVVAYHVLEKHPGDTMTMTQQSYKCVRIPSNQMIHVYLRERVTQTRGIPWGVSSMSRARMLDGYEQAELVAARAGASKMGFIIEKEGEEYKGDDIATDGNGNETIVSDFDAGTFERLPVGVDVKLFDPQHPSGNFDTFTKRILRGISAGFGIGYNTLANDYESVNYSSLRQSNLSERDCWKRLQQWLIESLHDEIFSDWLEMAITAQAITLPITKLDKFNVPTWRPRGWSWVDPLKEIQALKIAMSLGVESATSSVSDKGRDIEEIYQDMKNESALRERYGITLQSPDDIIITEKDKEDKNDD